MVLVDSLSFKSFGIAIEKISGVISINDLLKSLNIQIKSRFFYGSLIGLINTYIINLFVPLVNTKIGSPVLSGRNSPTFHPDRSDSTLQSFMT